MGTTEILGFDTLVDVMNEYTSMDGDGKYLSAAKVLHRKCPWVRYLPMIKSNTVMGQLGTRESNIGSPGTRRFNEGVEPSTTKSAPYSEQIAMFEDYSEVDLALWEIQNEPNKWRQGKDERKLEGMTQKVETEIIYGSQDLDPGSFDGVETRFNSLTYVPNGDTSWPYNVIGASGTGADLCSLIFVEGGPEKVFGVYPKNLPGGLSIKDLGQVTKDESGKLHEVLRTWLRWFFGLVIEDERCIQRICNIESAGSSNIIDPDDMITAKNNLPSMGEAPGTVIFCNRTLKTQLDIQAKDKSNGFYTAKDIFGMSTTHFQGVPIHVAEKMLITESQVT